MPDPAAPLIVPILFGAAGAPWTLLFRARRTGAKSATRNTTPIDSYGKPSLAWGGTRASGAALLLLSWPKSTYRKCPSARKH